MTTFYTDTHSGNNFAEILVIDSRVSDYQTLVQGMAPGTEVIIIDGGDGLEKLAETLEGRSNIHSIHIISHGSEGRVYLGDAVLSDGTLAQYAGELEQIGSTLSQDGDLLFYGCNVGKDSGVDFLHNLARLTRADVAASDDITGKGGDWVLELATGSIEASSVIGEKTLEGYSHSLAMFNFDTEDGTVGTENGADSIPENQYVSTVAGVTMTVTLDAGTLEEVNYSGSSQEIDNDYLQASGSSADIITISFDTPVNISSLVFGTIVGSSLGTYTLTPDAGSTLIKINPGQFTEADMTKLDSDDLGNWNGVSSFTITRSPAAWAPLLDSIVFTVANANPTISGAPSFITVTEDTATNVGLGAVTVADADGDNITLKIVAGAGTFSTPADGAGVTETLVNATTITLSGAAADINAYLDIASNIQYTGASDAAGNAATTLTLTVDDGTSGDVGSTSVDVNITAVNDNPTATGVSGSVTVTEDTASDVDLGGVTLSDVDSGSVTLTISAGAGTFSTPADGAGVTETLVNATTITLAGAAGDINAYLGDKSNIQYTGAANVNGNAATTLTLTANDGDGSGDVALGTVNVDITAVNDAPILTTTASPSLTTIQEDLGGPSNGSTDNATLVSALIDSGGSMNNFSDVEGNDVGIAVVGVSSGTLYYTTDGGTNWTALSAVAADSALVLNADANTLVYFAPSANVNGTVSDAVTFKAWDRTASSNGSTGMDTTTGTAFSTATDTVSVTISAVNDDPAAAGLPAGITVTERTATNVDISAVTLSDADAGTGDITLTITAAAGTLAASSGGSVIVSNSGTSAITLTGTVANIDTYLNTASNITYTSPDGTTATTLSLTANDGGNTGSGEGNNVDLGTVSVTVDQLPEIDTATYNANTGVLSVTGANIAAGGGNDINAAMFTFTGEGGATHTLTDTADVNRTSDTQFTLTLSTTDKAAVNQIINKDGTTSTSGTDYNLAVADDWNTGFTTGDSSDTTGNAITAGNVATPVIDNAGYNASTGVITVSGSGFVVFSGAANDIDASMFTFTGEGGATYTLTDSSDVEISSGTVFTVTLSNADKAKVNLMLNKDGTSSTGGTAYNLAAGEDWIRGADATVNVADTAGKTITVSNVAAPAITSATYTKETGILKVTGTNLLGRDGTNNDIVASNFTIKGQAAGTYTLTDTPDVDVTSTTEFSLSLSATDKTEVEKLLDKNGTASTDATIYNLAAAEDWNIGADASVNIADTTGNGITADLTVSANNGGGGTPTPDPEPEVIPPEDSWENLPDNDGDGVPELVENFVPGMENGGTQGDGNGDGVLDSNQRNVASVPFRNTNQITQNPDAEQTFVSLAAAHNDPDTPGSSTVVSIQNVKQQDIPEDSPAGTIMPLGLISFDANIATAGASENFNLFVDDALLVNGYWKQNNSGEWVNLASAEYGGNLVTENGKTCLNFTLTDGGEFDSDGVADGVITDPGAVGYLTNLTVFDEVYYLASKLSQLQRIGETEYKTSADVKAAIEEHGWTVYEHFVLYSLLENTDPSAYFSTSEYMQAKVEQLNVTAYEDKTDWTLESAAAAFNSAGFTNALDHFRQYGWKENVDPSNEFDVSNYFSTKAVQVSMTEDQVKNIFDDFSLDPLTHFENWGQYEDGVFISRVPASESVIQTPDSLELHGVLSHDASPMVWGMG